VEIKDDVRIIIKASGKERKIRRKTRGCQQGTQGMQKRAAL